MDIGCRMENVTAEFVESRRLLRAAGFPAGELPTLPDLARSYIAHRPQNLGTLTLPAAIEATPLAIGTLASGMFVLTAAPPVPARPRSGR